jgi:hypothetical protein
LFGEYPLEMSSTHTEVPGEAGDTRSIHLTIVDGPHRPR